MHYGYIGLGNLGAACAGCLVKAGFQVTVYDLNPALTVEGATRAESAEALAAGVDGLRVLPRRRDLAGVERVVVLAGRQIGLGNPASSA